MKIRLLAAAAPIAVASALLLGACSSGDHDAMGADDAPMGASHGSMSADTAPSIPADAEFNATDVAFAQGMIPHHAQAIEMSEMALTQATDARVTELATAIRAAQGPEIDQLTAWLQGWGQPVPATTGGASHDMSQTGGMMMSGMMSDDDMARLAGSSGPSFDRLWAEMMIEHHRGAITMAQEQARNGEYQPAKDMAITIVATQQGEIDQMQALLTQLPT